MMLLKVIGSLVLFLLCVPLGFILRFFMRKRLLARLPTDSKSAFADGLSFESPNVVIRWSDPATLVRDKLRLNQGKLAKETCLFGLEVSGNVEFCREVAGSYFSNQLISTLEVWGPLKGNTPALLSEYESTAARLIELLGTPTKEVVHTHVCWGPDHRERIWDLGWLCVTHRFQVFRDFVMCQNLLFDRRASKT